MTRAEVQMAGDPTNPDKSQHSAIASSLHYGLEGVRDPRVAIAVDLLSRGKTYGEVAAALDIDRSTLWDLRRQYNIDDIVAELAIETVDAGHRRMRAHYAEAIDVLVDVMRQADGAKDRLAAAKELITHIKQDARVSAYLEKRGFDARGLDDSAILDAAADEGAG